MAANSLPSHSAGAQGSQGQSKAWQPRWAPKLKRTTPAESVTTYSPILDAPLPPLPTSVASPPPALMLDDTAFGRPFSTTGLLDLNASRFSFLDMSNKDNDSDSDSEHAHATTSTSVPRPPTIQEPPIELQAGVGLPMSATLSPSTGLAEPAMRSSSLRPASGRDTLRPPPSSSPFPTDDARSPQLSLPTSSPALASLISSFPSPTSREAPSSETPPVPSLPSAHPSHNGAIGRAPAMLKENSWDGGERWDVEGRKHSGVPAGHASTELPYLDMDDEDETELLEASLAEHSAVTMRPTLSSSSTTSPPRNRSNRNPPPRPAPTMALPELPTKAGAQSDVRQHTPTGSIQLGGQQHENGPASGRSSKQGQRPLILPTLRSSSSIDRLALMGSSNSSPSDELAQAKMPGGSNLKPLTLRRNASTDELAKSLDIPRETVKQMLDTTQHVWRSHLLGSSALQNDIPSTNGLERLSRSSSSPMLSTLFASQGSLEGSVVREDLSKGSVARSHANRGSNRTSTLGLPYISSSRPSFEQQSPGWAMSKSSTDTAGPSTMEAQAERAKHRRTFLGRSSEDGPTASYNFSRPIRREANGADGALGASASMPALSAVRDAPKPPALLQSPLLLKGESEATGFAQFAVDDEQEILVDSASASEAHKSFVLAPAPVSKGVSSITGPADARSNVHKPMPELPQQSRTPSPRLARRNSDTVLNRFAPEFGKRAPGELHAWSVCIDDDGVPAIRPSPSAFHRPECPLAGKNNATWQCGCRSAASIDLVRATPQQVRTTAAQSLAVPGQASPGRHRSLSASNAMDPARQAQLWSQVERNKELIRKHEQEIAGLQEQVVRISTEMASARPSSSSAFATPELGTVPVFPAPPSKVPAITRKPLPSIASAESDRPPVPSKVSSIEPFPSVGAATAPAVPASAAAQVQPPRTLRGRIASLSKMNLAGRDENVRPAQSLDLGHSRLRSSSSTSSLNKVFRFPWTRSSEKEAAFPQPTPFPLGERGHGNAASATVPRDKTLPNLRMQSVDESRPLPAPPLSEATLFNKDKRYPPSSRKYSYEMLHGPAFHTSVGSRHLRGRSGSSKSSSFGTGTSIFSSSESNEMHESSRFAGFARLGRRWDSISSRGTSASARNSAEVAQPNGTSFGSMPALSAVAGKPLPASSEMEVGPRRSEGRAKTPPPRRSSLRKSLEAAPAPRRTPIPAEFLQANDAVMAPISEQSELGSPASARLASIHADLEMSPASVMGASPAGPMRMSMSERYRLQGLTVPAPLALSSSLTSPALGCVAEPGSGIKVGEGPRSPTSPRSARSPLPVAFSHGALTVARRPSLSSRS